MATAGENMEQTRADADAAAAEKLDCQLHIVRETGALMNSSRAPQRKIKNAKPSCQGCAKASA
jgi:hypothetical protein